MKDNKTVITEKELLRIAKKFKKSKDPKDKESLLHKNYRIKIKDTRFKIIVFLIGIILIVSGLYILNCIDSESYISIAAGFLFLVSGIISIIIGFYGKHKRLQKINDSPHNVEILPDIGGAVETAVDVVTVIGDTLDLADGILSILDVFNIF